MLSFPVPGPASFPEIHPGRAAPPPGTSLQNGLCRCGREVPATGPEGTSHERDSPPQPEHTGARVTVRLQPEDHWLSIPRPKTSRQLLTALGLAEECALVARDGELLTPDRQIWPNDELLVRKVASVG